MPYAFVIKKDIKIAKQALLINLIKLISISISSYQPYVVKNKKRTTKIQFKKLKSYHPPENSYHHPLEKNLSLKYI